MSARSHSLLSVMTFGGRTPTYSDFVQAVRAYAPSHLVEYLARYCAERGGWDVQLRRGMRPPWIAAAMVRDCIVASHEGRAGQLSERKLARLFNLFNETHDVHGDDIQSLLTPILYEQFPYQQSQYEEIVRSIALFEDAYDGSREWPWYEILGAPLADILTMSFIIHTVVMQSSGRFELRPEFEEVVDVLGYSQSLPIMVAGLTRTLEEMRVAATSVPPGEVAHRRFSYNPLIRTPLVDVGSGVFSPVPSLIYGAVSPSVLYHRGRDAWGDEFTRDLGNRVQQYVGKQIELLSPHFTIVGEVAYEKGELSADWFLASDDLLVIVECKASRATLGTQLGTAALDTQFKRDIGKAKQQIERSAAIIAARHPEFSRLGNPRQMIGLIITAEPFYIVGNDHTRELAEGTPTLLGSLRDIEHLATLTGSEAGQQLREIVEDPEKRTWPLGNSLDVPHNREARNPILESVWERSPLAVPVARRLAESRSGEKS